MTELSLPELNEAYDGWVRDRVDEAFDAAKIVQYERGWDWLVECGYFMTITFNQKQIAAQKVELALKASDTSIELDTFHGCYVDILDKLVGKRWQKGQHRAKWPLAIVGMDFGNSRVARFTELTGNNLHIHAIWAVHPDTKAAFEILRTDPHRVAKFQTYGPLDAIEFDPFDAEKKDMSYVTKGDAKTSRSDSQPPMARVYPNSDPLNKHLAYPLTHSYLPLTQDLKKLRLGMRKDVYSEKIHLKENPGDKSEDWLGEIPDVKP